MLTPRSEPHSLPDVFSTLSSFRRDGETNHIHGIHAFGLAKNVVYNTGTICEFIISCVFIENMIS